MAVNIVPRIFVKIIVVLVFVLPLALAHSGLAQIISILLFAIGTISIFETLRVYKKLSLKNDVLIIDSFFAGRESHELNALECWKVNEYYLRGHLHRSLILFFHRKKIIISLYNDRVEFDKVSNYLEKSYKTLEIE